VEGQNLNTIFKYPAGRWLQELGGWAILSREKPTRDNSETENLHNGNVLRLSKTRFVELEMRGNV